MGFWHFSCKSISHSWSTKPSDFHTLCLDFSHFYGAIDCHKSMHWMAFVCTLTTWLNKKLNCNSMSETTKSNSYQTQSSTSTSTLNSVIAFQFSISRFSSLDVRWIHQPWPKLETEMADIVGSRSTLPSTRLSYTKIWISFWGCYSRGTACRKLQYSKERKNSTECL